MKIIETDDLQRILTKLPQEIQQLYLIQKDRFAISWRDSRLHVKKVQSLSYALSFRITRRYRVFFYFQDAETAIFFDVDHRKDIYR
jgi:mRNA-degrading endonuclease RelE of RelBE toxin-antitoxin system